MSVLDRLPVGILETDLQGRCTYVNSCWSGMAGVSMDDALGSGWLAAVHREDRARIGDAWTEGRKTGSFILEYRFQKGEDILWVRGQVALREERGEHCGFVEVVTDISRGKVREEQLFNAYEEVRIQSEDLAESRERLISSERRFRTLFQNAPVGYFILNRYLGVTEVNQAGLLLLNRDSSECGL